MQNTAVKTYFPELNWQEAARVHTLNTKYTGVDMICLSVVSYSYCLSSKLVMTAASKSDDGSVTKPCKKTKKQKKNVPTQSVGQLIARLCTGHTVLPLNRVCVASS